MDTTFMLILLCSFSSAAQRVILVHHVPGERLRRSRAERGSLSLCKEKGWCHVFSTSLLCIYLLSSLTESARERGMESRKRTGHGCCPLLSFSLLSLSLFLSLGRLQPSFYGNSLRVMSVMTIEEELT